MTDLRRVQTYPIYKIEEVGDGDTITAMLDLRAETFRRMRLRLVVVDCPERGMPGADEATAFSEYWLEMRPHLFVDLQLTRTGRLQQTFGRYMADIYDSTGDSLSEALLLNDHARVWS